MNFCLISDGYFDKNSKENFKQIIYSILDFTIYHLIFTVYKPLKDFTMRLFVFVNYTFIHNHFFYITYIFSCIIYAIISSILQNKFEKANLERE